ncbi:hypothetical protein ACJ73_05738 [Blastomyces percursus]|uniref:Uncharacterized protein n=1 Tax=Blastomyces percursus TaxID=1658174 RepID=A0A1J9Q320_9EURO|nr:hypothetical protein ACJ73_05738 [Blastomyces percursus]
MALDLIDLRRETEGTESFNAQRGHAEAWKMLGGHEDITIVHTVKQAVQYIRENYHKMNILVTGSHYLVGSTLYTISCV